MADVKELISLMRDPSKEDIALVTRAYAFAEKAHKGHERHSGEPYFFHSFETAKKLAEIGMGPRTIAAGLLHDTIEDATVSAEEIKTQFGDEVLFLVEGVTKLGRLKYRGMERHIESLRKLFVATSQDIRVLIIRLTDRLHNMKTLEHVPEHKQYRIALETLEVYAPVADRLGMGAMKRELEDLSFKYVYPEEYRETLELMNRQSKETEKYLEKVDRSVKKELGKQNFTSFRTEYRKKGLYSLYGKLQRKERDIAKIYDIAALRIIVPAIDDCYRVLGIIHGMWRPLPGKIKDYIAFEKPNGYQSIHTTIFTGDGGIVEIQIRTEEMHRNAQYGIASHIVYKAKADKRDGAQSQEGGGQLWIAQFLPALFRRGERESAQKPEEDKKARKRRGGRMRYGSLHYVPNWIKDIAEAYEHAGGSEDMLNKLKADFFSHRVFVFTPQGDVIDLPIDSSPVDFAYAVHSDIGNHMSGVKVNGKMVSLDTKLKNGDIVDVQTKQSVAPTQKWLDIAKTSAARKHIRTVLQQNQK